MKVDKTKELKSLINDPILMNNMTRVIKNIMQPMTEEEKKKRYEKPSMTAKQFLDTLKESKAVISEMADELEVAYQRINELEQRWSELKKRMEHDEKEAFGEGDVIAHTVHNYVLELMDDLEEGDE